MTWQCKRQLNAERRAMAEYIRKVLENREITPNDLELVEWVKE